MGGDGVFLILPRPQLEKREISMKILLTAVNAKYIHSNLAVRNLKAYAKRHVVHAGLQIEFAEYTINQHPDYILTDLYRRHPDVLCFSCYIWNAAYIKNILREFKKLRPDTDIWLGGPEVSYDACKVLCELPQVKGVMKGEGEAVFADVCRIYLEEILPETVEGITFRNKAGEVTETPWRGTIPMDELPFVYNSKNIEKLRNKIIYYETSRGCPFSCSYCLSSVDKRLRFRSLSLVRRELQFFLDCGVTQVKFVDRTFNCRHDHALEIWRYIAEHDNGITNFHFEISADLLNEDELILLESMRPGLVQLEIGVQSANPDTIREIHRSMNLEKIKENVKRIWERRNIHQHLDLIAGLPFEDIKSFACSFNKVYAMKPDQLQLGFLKVLKGSYMEENKKEYGLVYRDTPPYEVLYTKWLSYEDISELKGVEEMVEVYYNSGQFTHTLAALEEKKLSPYRLYQKLWQYYDRHHYLEVEHKRSRRYEIFLDFLTEAFPEDRKYMQEQLIYDYYLRENAKTRPEFAGPYYVGKEFLRKFYEKEKLKSRYLRGYELYDKNQMRKMTHIEYFPVMGKLLLFDYKWRNPLNQEARTCMIEKGDEYEF